MVCHISSLFQSEILKNFRAVGSKVGLILAVSHTAHTWQLNYEDSGLAFTRATFHGTANLAIGSRFWSNHRDKRGTNKFLPFCNRARDNFLCVSSHAYVDSTTKTVIDFFLEQNLWNKFHCAVFVQLLCNGYITKAISFEIHCRYNFNVANFLFKILSYWDVNRFSIKFEIWRYVRRNFV